jgi:hypothetical protein
MFVGRVAELNRLEAALLQARAEQPEHFMITGERGIGKTSLLMYLRYVAEGKINIGDESVSFLVVETDIDKSTTQISLIQKIELALTRQLGKSEPARKVLKDAWSFLKRVRIMDSGVENADQDKSDELLVEEFAYTLASIVERTSADGPENIFNTKLDGVLILVDEADNSSPELNLGSFFKLLTERLQRLRCNRVVIGLAGLTELREILVCSHASSLRVFEDIELTRLTRAEVDGVVDLCLKRANEQNESSTSITDEAREFLARLAEGYPHFIQQFGHSAFAADEDWTIDLNDVQKGAFGQRGALEQIGNRYYRNDFYNKIQKESYRQVLRIMADQLDAWVTRQEIKRRFKGTESVMNNAIRALRERHIIIPKEGEKGIYRLQHRGFALWIKLYADPDFQRQLAAQNGGSTEAQEQTPSNN